MKIKRNAPCPCGSGKKYKHCHYPDSIEVIESFEELNGITKGYSPKYVLNLFQNISRSIGTSYYYLYKNFKITNFYLDFLLKFLSKNSDKNGKELNQNDFDKMIDSLINIPYDKDRLEYELQSKNFDYVIKSGFLQFPYNRSLIGFFGRVIIFYKFFKDYDKKKFKKFLEFKAQLGKKMGMDINLFFFIGFSLFVLVNKGNINIENIVNNCEEKLKRYVTKQNLEKFLDITSISYDELKSELYKIKKFTSDSQFELSIFKKFPIIKYEEEIYIPIFFQLLDRIANGIFYDFTDEYADEGKKNYFREFFGKHIFEPYIIYLFQECYENKEVVNDADYPERIGDFDCLAIKNNNCFLVECWTGSTSRELREHLDKAALDTFINRLLEKVQKLYKKYKYLKEKGFIQRKNKEEKMNFKNVFPILVTYEEIPYLNSYFRSKISEKLKENKESLYKELEGAINKNVFKYHMISTYEFEYLINILLEKQYNLEEILKLKAKGNEEKKFDIGLYMLAKLVLNIDHIRDIRLDIENFSNFIESDFDDFFFYTLKSKLGFSKSKEAFNSLMNELQIL